MVLNGALLLTASDDSIVPTREKRIGTRSKVFGAEVTLALTR